MREMGLETVHLDTVVLAWFGTMCQNQVVAWGGPRGQFYLLTVSRGIVTSALPTSRALNQAWKQSLNDPLGPNEVGGTSSLGNIELSQTETGFASSLLLGRVKSIPLTSQAQSLSLVPCCK